MTAAAALQTGRAGHVAVTLANGKIMVIGGQQNNGIRLGSCEIYDPATDTWTPTASLSTPRIYHTAMVLANGKVLVVGGRDQDILDSAELYDPVSATWSSAGTMSIPRQEHAAVLLDNNRVLVVGGYSAASAELYNPATNSWSPAGAMQDARIYHAVVKLSNGKVLAVGGADEFGDPLASADLYNPATNSWSPTGALGVARGSLTLTLLNNGKVLASGGKLNVFYLTSTELYDPATATWTPTDSLATGRGGHTATMLANGSVLVVGGYNGDILDSVELFAPDTGTWSTIGSLVTPRIGHTASLLADSVVIAGGYGPVGYIHAALSSTERLDVAYSLTVSASGPGTVAGAPASGSYPLGTVVQLTATSNPGSMFLGWTVDNLFRGWGSLLTFTMNGPHTVAAVFAGVPTFPDVSAADPANTAIGSLASRGIIKGYQDGTFGPNNSTQRSQMAALIARAMGWEQEDWGNPFVDGNGLDPNLWRNVGTLAHYQVALGYDPTHFAPNDTVTRAQTISFITRAMVAKGYWTQQADNPALFANVPASSGHRQDLATYVYYAGALPDLASDGPFTGWDQPATRAWFSRSLWRALDSYFGVPVVIP